jgi:hypothetical protein
MSYDTDIAAQTAKSDRFQGQLDKRSLYNPHIEWRYINHGTTTSDWI